MKKSKCSKIRDVLRLTQISRKWRNLVSARNTALGSHSPKISALSSWFSSIFHHENGAGRVSNPRCGAPADVPAGHLAVYVGKQCTRFVIRATYLNRPVFRTLLEAAEEEFGYDYEGGLAIPCDELLFQHILRLFSGNDPATEQPLNLEELQRILYDLMQGHEEKMQEKTQGDVMDKEEICMSLNTKTRMQLCHNVETMSEEVHQEEMNIEGSQISPTRNPSGKENEGVHGAVMEGKKPLYFQTNQILSCVHVGLGKQTPRRVKNNEGISEPCKMEDQRMLLEASCNDEFPPKEIIPNDEHQDPCPRDMKVKNSYKNNHEGKVDFMQDQEMMIIYSHRINQVKRQRKEGTKLEVEFKDGQKIEVVVSKKPIVKKRMLEIILNHEGYDMKQVRRIPSRGQSDEMVSNYNQESPM
ncbi:hypothetical protein KI387_035552 [Taxus chinensis]|uniref:Uncharacterized protein n=1 Tax=Taxus chinensis TaxID=29808 RepID=A0AA38KNH7_TAXCH|nr:hypothetical protein KI387_035552 [Taxus chinensis]